MTANKSPLPAAALRPEWGTQTAISQTSPCTPEERRQRIEALGSQIAGYVRFMCNSGDLGGTSAEAKEKAVAAFYEQLVLAEHRLGRIHEGLRLE
jgi:hypothetical protein